VEIHGVRRKKYAVINYFGKEAFMKYEKMAALADGMKQGIWFDKAEVEQAEYNYQMFLTHGKSWKHGMNQSRGGGGSKRKNQKKRMKGKEESEKGGSGTYQLRPNYFFAVPIHNLKILGRIRSVQDHILEQQLNLEKAIVPATTAHITLTVFHLKDDTEVKSALSLLSSLQTQVQDIVNDTCLHLQLKGIGNFRNQVVYAEIQQDESCEKLKSIAELLNQKIAEITGEEKRKTDFKAHVTLMKLSKMRKSKVKAIPSSLYRNIRNIPFGDEKAAKIQLLSMLKPKHNNGYYTCEGSINIDDCIHRLIGEENMDFSLPNWAETLSIACITQGIYCYVCSKDVSGNNNPDDNDIPDASRNPGKRIKLDPG